MSWRLTKSTSSLRFEGDKDKTDLVGRTQRDSPGSINFWFQSINFDINDQG